MALLGEDGFYVDSNGVHFIPKGAELNDTDQHIKNINSKYAPSWAICAQQSMAKYRRIATNWVNEEKTITRHSTLNLKALSFWGKLINRICFQVK